MALNVLSSEEQLFKETIQKFAQEAVQPHVTTMDETAQLHPDIIPQLFSLGLMGLEVAEKFNGSASSFFMTCLAIEELSKVDPSVALLVDVQNTLVNNIFLKFASPTQQAQYLPQLATQRLGAFCLTETHSGSDAFALQTKAIKEGDSWILEGKKIFITNALEASIYIVFANIDPSKGYKGITAFIVEKDNPGLKIGKKENKLGIRASSTCEVILDKAKVKNSAMLGELGKGYKIAIETLNEGRIGIAAQLLGMTQGAFKHAVKYAYDREQFGQRLNHFQAIQFQLAEIECKIESMRCLVYNAAKMKDQGLPFTREAAIAKYMCSKLAEESISSALEVFGGYGFIKEFPLEKFYRDVKIGKLYEGTSHMQLATIFKLIN